MAIFLRILLQSSLEDAKALFAACGMKVSTWSEVPKAVKLLKERNEALHEKAAREDEALREKEKAVKEKDEIVKQKEKAQVNYTFVRTKLFQLLSMYIAL